MINIERVKNGVVYYYIKDDNNSKNTGIYKKEEDKKPKQIINLEVYDIDITNKNIYIVTKSKTSRSIVRFDLDGNSKKELSDKYIVNQIKCINDNIYFTTTKDYKLYVINKNDKIEKLTNNKVENIKNVVVYKENIFYVNSGNSNTLYKKNSTQDERIIKKNIESVQIDGNVIYYKIKDSIGIYKYDVLTENTAQLTSARTNEYICKN